MLSIMLFTNGKDDDLNGDQRANSHLKEGRIGGIPASSAAHLGIEACSQDVGKFVDDSDSARIGRVSMTSKGLTINDQGGIKAQNPLTGRTRTLPIQQQMGNSRNLGHAQLCFRPRVVQGLDSMFAHATTNQRHPSTQGKAPASYSSRTVWQENTQWSTVQHSGIPTSRGQHGS